MKTSSAALEEHRHKVEEQTAQQLKARQAEIEGMRQATETATSASAAGVFLPRVLLLCCVKPLRVRVRFHIIRNARIYNVFQYQSCMVSKLRIIWKQTVVVHARVTLCRVLPLRVLLLFRPAVDLRA